MKKKWLAMLLALTMAVSPAAVQTVDASTADIEAGITATSPYEDTTAKATEAYEYTITGDDGSVAVVSVPAMLETMYTKYTPGSNADTYVEDGIYVIVGAHANSANKAINSDAELTYNEGITIENDVVTPGNESYEWQITNVDGGYTIQAVDGDGYLNITSNDSPTGATVAVDSQVLAIASNTNISGVTGAVSIGNTTVGGYLNIRRTDGVGTWSEADGGCSWYLYKIAYKVTAESVAAVTEGVGTEADYTSASWETYETALANANTETVYETEDAAVAVYNALVAAVEGLTENAEIDAVYKKYIPGSNADVFVEDGIYVIVGAHANSANKAINSDAELTYNEGITIENDVVTPGNESYEWQITNVDGGYTIQAVDGDGYLNITSNDSPTGATVAVDSQVLAIASNTNISGVTGAVSIGNTTVGGYLNIRRTDGVGTWSEADGGCSWYLYKAVYTISDEELDKIIREANGNENLFSEIVYDADSASAYEAALKAARGSFDTRGAASQAVESLRAAVKAMKEATVTAACFPEMSWEVTADTDSDETETGKNYISNLDYINTTEFTENEITFKQYEALTWTWDSIARLVENDDTRTSPVWLPSEVNGMSSSVFSPEADNETFTQADVYKISGEFTWPEGYDLHDTTIILDSANDFYYYEIYDYIAGKEEYSDIFPLAQVLPVNDDVYVVMWAGDTAPTLPTEGDDGINNYLAFWSGTSGKGIWSQKDETDADWIREEPATFIDWNLQGERAFRKSYPNAVGTGAVEGEDGNEDVAPFEYKYLEHTDGWYTLTDTAAVNSVMRANYPNGIEAGTTVHLDLYVMNNSKAGVIDELTIELIKEQEEETEVFVKYYLNTVSEDTLLGTEVLTNQAYGKEITILPGTGAGQLNSYKAQAIFDAGYKEVTDGVQQGTVPYKVVEGQENVINVLYTVKNNKTIYLTAATDEFEYNGSERVLNTVTVTQGGQEAELLDATKGSYRLPDGNIVSGVFSYVRATTPGIYANNFTLEDGQASNIDNITIKTIIETENEDGTITETEVDVTNTYEKVAIPGTLTITYDPKDVTRTYDFGVENVYADVLEAVELKATPGETGDNVVITDNDVSYTPLAANTGESIALTLTFAGDYTVTKTLNFIPASNVMYEDGFVTAAEGWTSVLQQSREVTDNENTVYGYSEAYNSDIAWSNGTAMAATLTLENGASTVETAGAATFGFTGTGFDLISECGPNTGMLLVKVTNATEANKAKFYLVDTYFTGDEDYITGTTVLDYQVPVIRAMDLPYGEHEVSVWGYLADTTGAGAAAAAYGLNGELADSEASSRIAVSAEDIVMAALDDLGLSDEVDASDVEVSFIDENSTLNGGTGNVTGSGSAIAMFALTDEESADTAESTTTTANVYIDGFRVYGALEDESNYTGNETGLKYASVYEYAQNSAGDMSEDIIGESLVYVEYDGDTDVASIAQYKNQGPQNEVYLSSYNAIGFLLKNYTEGMTVMVSAKAVSEGAILGAMNQDFGFEAIGDSLSATEMYYDVSEYVVKDEDGQYMLAFNNEGDGILSISELKLDELIEAAESADVGEVIVDVLEKANTEAAFVPERFEVSYNDTVKLNKTTSIKVSTSLPVEGEPENTVERVELFDTDPTGPETDPVKTFKFTNKTAVSKGRASYCSFSVSVKVTEDVTYWAVAYNEKGEASAPLEITISVQ